MANPKSVCIACDQYDDAPKIQHLGVYVDKAGVITSVDAAGPSTFHFDCFPYEIQDEQAAAIADQARKGVRNDKLRAYLTKQGLDGTEAPAESTDDTKEV